MTNFEFGILSKIDNGEKLTVCEIKTLIFDYTTDSEESEYGRMTSIVEIRDRAFVIHWCKSLPRYQESEGYGQPHEVKLKLKDYEKLTNVREWRDVQW